MQVVKKKVHYKGLSSQAAFSLVHLTSHAQSHLFQMKWWTVMDECPLAAGGSTGHQIIDANDWSPCRK